MKYRNLKPELIVQTEARLLDRIAQRFPGSGLSEVGSELHTIAQQTASRAHRILRPNLILRIVVLVLLVGCAVLLFEVGRSIRLKADLLDVMNFVEFVEATIGTVVFVGAAVLFLVTLEVRLRRRRALAAIHELRSLAHVVDMHQLTKHPEGLIQKHPPVTSDDPEQTTRNLYELNRYLHYCIELLAIISKLAPLYVQRFPDGPTITAVDQVEGLCSGLSHKIWQKIMILDRFLEDEEESA